MDELLREPVVSWLMRLGFLLSPPLAGLVADAAGLRLGLLVVPVAGIAVVSLGGVLRPGGRGVTRPFWRRTSRRPQVGASVVGR